MGGHFRVALIIPTLNEADAIGLTLAEIPREGIHRVIVADGGSQDATAEVAKAHAAEVLITGRGFGRACSEATAAATDVDIVAFMDGDGADDPAYLAALIAPIASGQADFVLASRVSGMREPGSMAWHQVFAGRALGLGMQLLYGTRYTDMCTFRAIRRDRLIDLDMRELSYGWNIEMQMRAARAGLRIQEIPTRYRCRRGGVSKVAGTLGGSLRAAYRIIGTFIRVAMQSPPPLPSPAPNPFVKG